MTCGTTCSLARDRVDVVHVSNVLGLEVVTRSWNPRSKRDFSYQVKKGRKEGRKEGWNSRLRRLWWSGIGEEGFRSATAWHLDIYFADSSSRVPWPFYLFYTGTYSFKLVSWGFLV